MPGEPHALEWLSAYRTPDKIIAASIRDLRPLPQSVVEQTGKSFVLAAIQNQDAWKVVLDLISHRSFLNGNDGPIGPVGPLPADSTWRYGPGAPTIPGKENPQLGFPREVGVPEQQAARFDLIGRDQNIGMPLAPAFLVMSGGALIIDGLEMRNVFVKGVEVHYSGKLAILRNVAFINCTFVLDNADSTRQLAQEVLTESRVNFPKA